MSPVPSVGKRVRVNHDWFWFYFCLVEEVARDFLTNHKAQQCKTKTIAEIPFGAQLKSAVMTNQTALGLSERLSTLKKKD